MPNGRARGERGEGVDDTFLRTHCILPNVLQANGATGVPFRQTATVERANVAVGGTTLRLPTTGMFSLQPLDAPRGTTATGRLTFSYWDFEEDRSSVSVHDLYQRSNKH